jgi:hypothetical protein
MVQILNCKFTQLLLEVGTVYIFEFFCGPLLYYFLFYFPSPFLYTSSLSFSISHLKSAYIIMSTIYLRLDYPFWDKFQEEKLYGQNTMNILTVCFPLIFTSTLKLHLDLCVFQCIHILYKLITNFGLSAVGRTVTFWSFRCSRYKNISL